MNKGKIIFPLILILCIAGIVVLRIIGLDFLMIALIYGGVTCGVTLIGVTAAVIGRKIKNKKNKDADK